jgi:glyoxylase-like metal-dependent hydrolase (beta-lactamase superfamily II)
MRGIAPGVRWLRMPLPFALDHINLWLLEDEGGWTIVDTGLGEAIAHLHFLERAGSLRRTVGADGLARFAPAKEEAWKSALTA